jgi:hypothetical protein
MADTTEPITVTISHRLGRDGAKRRIAEGFDAIHREIGAYVRSFEYTWDGDRMKFRATAMLQTVTGDIEVFDDFVRVDLILPGLLHVIGRTIAGRIQQRGQALLEGPKNTDAPSR